MTFTRRKCIHVLKISVVYYFCSKTHTHTHTRTHARTHARARVRVCVCLCVCVCVCVCVLVILHGKDFTLYYTTKCDILRNWKHVQTTSVQALQDYRPRKVVTTTVRCMCVRPCVCTSEIVRITFTVVDGFHNNFTQLFSITCRFAIRNIESGRPRVKVTLEGQIFVRTISPIFDGFQCKFKQLFSITSRCAIRRFHSGMSKVKVMRVQRVFPGQPSSFKTRLLQRGKKTGLVHEG